MSGTDGVRFDVPLSHTRRSVLPLLSSFVEIFQKSTTYWCCITTKHYNLAGMLCFFAGILLTELLHHFVHFVARQDCCRRRRKSNSDDDGDASTSNTLPSSVVEITLDELTSDEGPSEGSCEGTCEGTCEASYEASCAPVEAPSTSQGRVVESSSEVDEEEEKTFTKVLTNNDELQLKNLGLMTGLAIGRSRPVRNVLLSQCILWMKLKL